MHFRTALHRRRHAPWPRAIGRYLTVLTTFMAVRPGDADAVDQVHWPRRAAAHTLREAEPQHPAGPRRVVDVAPPPCKIDNSIVTEWPRAQDGFGRSPVGLVSRRCRVAQAELRRSVWHRERSGHGWIISPKPTWSFYCAAEARSPKPCAWRLPRRRLADADGRRYELRSHAWQRMPMIDELATKLRDLDELEAPWPS